MDEKLKTMPETEFFKALDVLEKAVDGTILVTDEDLEKADPDKADETVEDDDGKTPPEDNDLKKADADDDDDDDDNGKDKDDDEIEKGFVEDAVDESENIEKAIEVSEFLADLVTKVGDAIDGIRKSVDDRFNALEKSVADGLVQNQKTTGLVVDALKKSFELVSSRADAQASELQKSLSDFGAEYGQQPARKLKARTSTVLDKSFVEEGDSPAMAKSMILKSMTDMFERGEPGITSMDIIRFESGGHLSPHLAQKFKV